MIKAALDRVPPTVFNSVSESYVILSLLIVQKFLILKNGILEVMVACVTRCAQRIQQLAVQTSITYIDPFIHSCLNAS